MPKPVIQDESGDSEFSTLADRTKAQIRRYIRDRELQPGDILPGENALSEQLGVSRTVIREAFRALAALGILEVGNGRKARVAAPDADPLSLILDHTVHTRQLSFQQILDVRRTLELRTASLAALRRSEQDVSELRELVAQMFSLIEEPDLLMEADIRFHEVIARASGNSLYAILVNSFRVITRQTWHIGWRCRCTFDNRQENIRCHERIALAIIEQDPERAEAAITEHFDSAISILLRAGIT